MAKIPHEFRSAGIQNVWHPTKLGSCWMALFSDGIRPERNYMSPQDDMDNVSPPRTPQASNQQTGLCLSSNRMQNKLK